MQATSKPDGSSPLHALIRDARRFVLYNRSIIEEAPLQLYSASLVFSPERSIIRGQFSDKLPRWVSRLPKVGDDWGPVLQVLEGHSSPVYAVSFSLDGQLLASASYGMTVRLWDAATRVTHRTLEGHSGGVSAVAFSLDGILASASQDKTVRLWDAKTGVLRSTLEGHSDDVTSVT